MVIVWPTLVLSASHRRNRRMIVKRDFHLSKCEDWHRKVEATVAAVAELGEVAEAGAFQGLLDVSEHGVHPIQIGCLDTAQPAPALTGWWPKPASMNPPKQAKPSDCTVVPRSK